MVKERKFYKTTVIYEVLSEEPIPGQVDLAYIAHECDEGEYVGRFLETKEQVMNAKEIAKELYSFGSEPGFFNLIPLQYD